MNIIREILISAPLSRLRNKVLYSVIFVITCQLIANSASAESPGIVYDVNITGGSMPVITLKSNLPEGTPMVVAEWPQWAPNAINRIRLGLSACDPVCGAITQPTGWQTELKNGAFKAGPFSMNGNPLSSGRYFFQVGAIIGELNYKFAVIRLMAVDVP
jgi:hypothetical protein